MYHCKTYKLNKSIKGFRNYEILKLTNADVSTSAATNTVGSAIALSVLHSGELKSTFSSDLKD